MSVNKFKIKICQKGFSMVESCLAVFFVAIITISLTDYVESNAKTLNLRTDAQLLVNVENSLRQYIIANPDKILVDPDHPKTIQIDIADIKSQGYLGNYDNSKFYNSLKIFAKPLFSNHNGQTNKDNLKYFYGIDYLVIYLPSNNGTMGNEFNSIGRGQLINFTGAKSGVYNPDSNEVTGLTGGWHVSISDYSPDEDHASVDQKSKQIYLHSVIPLTQKESEIISLSCYDPRAKKSCSTTTINFSCNQNNADQMQKLIFTYSGHDVDKLTMDDYYNNLNNFIPDAGRGVFEFKLDNFCRVNTGKNFKFQPILTPSANNVLGKPFKFLYVLNLEKD